MVIESALRKRLRRQHRRDCTAYDADPQLFERYTVAPVIRGGKWIGYRSTLASRCRHCNFELWGESTDC